MIMHNTNRLFRGRRWIALLAVFTLLTALFALPLHAAAIPARGMMDDMRDGIRRFGREVSDALDPDTTDGLLPDGSIDDPMAENENPATTENGGIVPGVTTPATTTEASRTTAPVTTRRPTTSAPTTQEDASEAVTDTESGFRWAALIIILVVAAIVVLIVILLMPKKKT